MFARRGRQPWASINFITAHDGFTLNDLVSYNDKHNEVNGEGNHDGNNYNLSWNCGVEGPTDDPNIIALREKQKRNLLATLFLSQGVPMLLAGDEFGRTQHGNNNAYCQDNEISWVNWQIDRGGQALLAFTRHLIALRHQHPILHRRKFFQGQRIHGSEADDITWFRSDGVEMTDEEWDRSSVRCLGVLLHEPAMDEWDEHGNYIKDDQMLILMNAQDEAMLFRLPATANNYRWEVVVDTTLAQLGPPRMVAGGYTFELSPRSLTLLRLYGVTLSQ